MHHTYIGVLLLIWDDWISCGVSKYDVLLRLALFDLNVLYVSMLYCHDKTEQFLDEIDY